MGVAGQVRKGARAQVLKLLAGAAMATGCMVAAASPAVAQVSVRASDCFRDPLPRVADINVLSTTELDGIARECRRAADGSDSRSRAANAYYHAGRAGVILSGRYLSGGSRDEAARALGVATEALERVVDNSRDANRIYAAQLELARAYRMQLRYDEALRMVSQIMRTRPGLPNAAAQFEAAMVNLDRDGEAGLNGALASLEVFSRPDLDRDESPAIVARGRAELFRVAIALGNSALAEDPPTRESTMRAISFYNRARTAIEIGGGAVPAADASAVYLRLGNAYLRAAGLSGPAGRAEFSCQSRQGAPDGLNAALAAFRAAQRLAPTSAEAFFGEGCALQALDSPLEAIARFGRAAELAPTRSSYQLALAGALGAANRWNDASAAYQQALALERDRPAERARIHVEIADIHVRNGAVDDAIASLNSAIATNDAYGEAYLRRGRIYLEQRPNLDLAGMDLRNAQRFSRAPTERATQAEALYLLSQLEVLREQRARRTGNAATAISNADQAVALNEQEPRYWAQACLTRIFFGRVGGSGDGARYCTAGESREPAAQLYEGMYHLRRTFVTISGDQTREWEAALSAFTNGLTRLGEPRFDEDAEIQRLRSRMTVGRGIALFCVGLESIGRQTINGATHRADSEQYFDDFGVKLCASRR